MFGNTFGHGTIRKMVVYFGKLFNNITLNRYNSDGTLAQNMLVPLNYGPKEKFLARAQGNPELEDEVAIQLPRMAFEMSGFQYDATRKLNSINKISIQDPGFPGSMKYQYSPVPYNVTFNLYIMVKNAEDGTYIVEQILPYFTPSWGARININTDLNQSYDMPIFLNDVSSVDTYEGDFTNRRALIWTLQFTMQGWFFGPTTSGGKIIKQINTTLFVPDKFMTISDAFSSGFGEDIEIIVTPGETANGQPVNWYGKSTANNRPTTVSANTILSTSNYGFMVDFTEDV